MNNLTWYSKRALRTIYHGLRALPYLRLSVLRRVFSLMNKREKNLFIATAVIALISFFFAGNNFLNLLANREPAPGGTYREGMIGQPRFINPLFASSETDRSLVNLVFSGLYQFDSNGSVIPDLAENFPEVSDDGKVYTVKIKHGQWHNGLAITAKDVVFTVQTIQNQSFNSPRRTDWLSTTVEAPDDYTVKFTLKNASGPFLNNLTLPIVSQVVWGNISPQDAALAQGNIEAIGSGPYRIKEVKKLAQGTIQSITLESNQNFYNRPAYLSNVRINFYENSEELLKALHGNQIDGLGYNQFTHQISLKKSAKDFQLHQIPLPQYQAVFLNTTNKALGDKRVRTALNLATDKNSILNDVYDGQGKLIDSPILSEQVGGLSSTEATFNLDQANQMLEQAGWTFAEGANVRSKGGIELKFTLATNDNVVNVKTSEQIIEQWAKLGVAISLNSLPTKELSENVIKPRNYDMLLFVQKLGADPDPFVFWHSSQTKSPGLNLSNYVNQTVDSIISEARSSTDKTIRDQKYAELHEIIKQDLPAIFLTQTVYTYAIKQDFLGFNINTLPDETTRFYNLKDWYLNTKRVLK